MAIMAFNPHRLGSAPTGPNVSVRDLLLANQAQSQGQKDILANLAGIGEARRESKVRDLLSSDELKGLSEADAQTEIMRRADGSLGEDVQSQIDTLLGRKREEAKADAASKLLDKKSKSALELELAKDQLTGRRQAALESLKHENLMTKLDKEFGFKLDIEKLKSKSKGALAKQFGENVAEQVLSNPNFLDNALKKVEKVLDTDNWIFDAELKGEAEPAVREALRQALKNDDVTEFALGDKESIFNLVKKYLPKDLVLEEGVFGSISVKKKK